MKRKYLAGLAVMGLVALGLSGPANASLVVTGTVMYDGAARNLIYDNDLNITWLDYNRGGIVGDTWNNQQSWADNLSLSVLAFTYDNWRLPSTVHDPTTWYDPLSWGLNITTSEMGHLFYTELGNKGFTNPNSPPDPSYGLTHTGPFANLLQGIYWSGTEEGVYDPYYAYQAYYFLMINGYQGCTLETNQYSALAVHPGYIQGLPLVGGEPFNPYDPYDPGNNLLSVPEPASILLIGSGLAGLVGLGRKRRGH